MNGQQVWSHQVIKCILAGGICTRKWPVLHRIDCGIRGKYYELSRPVRGQERIHRGEKLQCTDKIRVPLFGVMLGLCVPDEYRSLGRGTHSSIVDDLSLSPVHRVTHNV